jgi:hypothetical protein
VLIEGDSEAGASPLVQKMLLGRAEVPKVLRGCTGVQGSPVLHVVLSPRMEPAHLELSVETCSLPYHEGEHPEAQAKQSIARYR